MDCPVIHELKNEEWLEAVVEGIPAIALSLETDSNVIMNVVPEVSLLGTEEEEKRIAQETVSRARAFCADTALQIFGGYGYCEEYPAEKLYRDARDISVIRRKRRDCVS